MMTILRHTFAAVLLVASVQARAAVTPAAEVLSSWTGAIPTVGDATVAPAATDAAADLTLLSSWSGRIPAGAARAPGAFEASPADGALSSWAGTIPAAEPEMIGAAGAEPDAR